MIRTICRTCDVQKTKTLSIHELTSEVEQYPDKCLYDLLFELTGIGLEEEDVAEKMPQNLCNLCKNQLQSSYGFVIQAREANERLILAIKNANADSINNYFRSPSKRNITVKLTPVDPLLEVIDIKEDPIDIDDSDCHLESQAALSVCNVEAQKMDEDLDQIKTFLISPSRQNVTEELTVIDPLVEAIDIKKETADTDGSENEPLAKYRRTTETICEIRQNKKRLFKCNQCSQSFHCSQNLKTHMRKHANKSDWFACPHCPCRFYRNDSLQIHLRSHASPKYRKYTKRQDMKVKEVNVNLCKPNGSKVIKCMICQKNFKKISDLKNHLMDHPCILFDQCKSLVETLYVNMNDCTEKELIERIEKDLENGKYFLFYSITNQMGHELSLDSSETESEPDDLSTLDILDNNRKTYTCEVCYHSYPRKYQLFEHQRQQHTWLEAVHVCSRCGRRFVCQELLYHHQRSQCKNSKKRFTCYKCPLRFSWKHNLSSHLKEQHVDSPSERSECPDCKRSFQNEKYLRVHMLTVHGEKKTICCQWCERKFYRRDRLVKHMIRHGIRERDVPLAEIVMLAATSANVIKVIECKVCKIKFKSIAELRNHLRNELKSTSMKHHEYSSFSNYSITTADGFELHIDDSETDAEGNLEDVKKSYTCELCRMQYRRKCELMQHQRLVHRYQKLPHVCEKCVFKTVSIDVLEYHQRTQCLNTEKKLVCDKCTFKFMWKENLELHRQLQHRQSEPDLNESVVKTKPKLSEAMECPHCAKIYYVKGCLDKHLKRVHIDGKNKVEKKLLCSICGLKYSCQSHLTTHLRVHTGEKPFKCDTCDMAFARQYQVVTHRRTHTGEKPFRCTLCNKDFSALYDLRKHNKSHRRKTSKAKVDKSSNKTRRKLTAAMECPYCAKKYYVKGCLDKHIRQVHIEK